VTLVKSRDPIKLSFVLSIINERKIVNKNMEDQGL
jgi:hypothetical protein